MGTFHHHFAIAVVSYNEDRAAQAFEKVKEFARSKQDDTLGIDFEHELLIGPISGVMNGIETYIMVPDGSKEWWSTSNTADEIRAYFIEQMSEVADVAHGSFGELATTFERVGDEFRLGDTVRIIKDEVSELVGLTGTIKLFSNDGTTAWVVRPHGAGLWCAVSNLEVINEKGYA